MYNLFTDKMYNFKEISALTGLSESHLTRRDGSSPIDRIKTTFPDRTDLFTLDDSESECLTEEGMSILNDYLLNVSNKCGTPSMSFEQWQTQIKELYYEFEEIEMADNNPNAKDCDRISPLVPVEPYEVNLEVMPSAKQVINNVQDRVLLMADEMGVQNKALGVELAHRVFKPMVQSFNETAESILKESFGGQV